MTGIIHLTVKFSHLTKGGQRYSVLSEDDEVLIESSRDPQHEIARLLLASGEAEPADLLIFHREDGSHSMHGGCAALAGQMTTEGQSYSIRTVPYREHHFAGGSEETIDP